MIIFRGYEVVSVQSHNDKIGMTIYSTLLQTSTKRLGLCWGVLKIVRIRQGHNYRVWRRGDVRTDRAYHSESTELPA